ncbi:hypothetical protein FQZ97_1120700 [compost metagenome]
MAARVALGDQVLEEGNLHGGTVDQHPFMPVEARLALEEAHVRRQAVELRVLLGGDGERQVGWAEADADVVVNEFHVFPLEGAMPWRFNSPASGSQGETVSPASQADI